MKRLGYILYRIANDLVSLFSRALNAFVFGGSAVQAWAEEGGSSSRGAMTCGPRPTRCKRSTRRTALSRPSRT